MNISDMRREKARLFSPALLSLDVTDPEFATIIARFAFGEVTQFGELETRERVIIALSAVIATNGREAFRMVLRGALKAGMKEEEMRVRDHDKEELSFYSKATTDIEFLFPFGWGELWGIADRTDYDLSRHAEVSGQDLTYFDDQKNAKYIPYVIEPSLGADRVVLAFLCSAYDEEEIGEGDVRTVLHFHPALAPVKIGILPLSKKLNEGAERTRSGRPSA